MTIVQLKKYILEHEMVPKILESLGCHHIRVHEKYVSAANPDGDNPGAINCYLGSNFINVKNWTRKLKDHADIIDLVQFVKQCNFTDAVKWLHEVCGLKFSYYAKEKEKNLDKLEDPFARLRKLKTLKYNTADVKPLDETVLGEFTNIEWIGLFREGVTPRACAKFGIMYSYKWKRVIFPHRYALDGKLLAYNARTTVDNYEELGISKFFITPGYQKQDNIYALWENRAAMEAAGICIVVESEKSVLKRYSLFDERFCAVSGHEISEEQRRLLAGLNVKEVVVSFDNDVPEEIVWSACDKLYPFKIVSYTKDKWGLMKKKDSIADLPDRECRFMLKHRIKYTEQLHKRYRDMVTARRYA